MKQFMVREAASCYICSFSIYTMGGGPSNLLQHNGTIGPDCSRTAKTVMGLLDKVQFLTLVGMCTLTITTAVLR